MQEDDAVAIPLTQGLVAYVDKEDASEVLKYKWHAVTTGSRTYAAHTFGPKTVYLHRWLLTCQKGEVVDHIDRDTMNCRRSNMRVVSPTESVLNRGKFASNRSGYRGVRWHKETQRWAAQITFNRKYYWLGLFDEPEEAARAYDQAARKKHGSFAQLNFPDK